MATAQADAHIQAQATLRRLTAQTVELIWRRLPGWDEANVPQFLDLTIPVVLAAQRQSVLQTDAYIGQALDRSAVGVDPEQLIGANVRNGTPPEDVYRRPFVQMWHSLSEGNQWQDAFTTGLARAKESATMDVQLSMRATLIAVANG